MVLSDNLNLPNVQLGIIPISIKNIGARVFITIPQEVGIIQNEVEADVISTTATLSEKPQAYLDDFITLIGELASAQLFLTTIQSGVNFNKFAVELSLPVGEEDEIAKTYHLDALKHESYPIDDIGVRSTTLNRAINKIKFKKIINPLLSIRADINASLYEANDSTALSADIGYLNIPESPQYEIAERAEALQGRALQIMYDANPLSDIEYNESTGELTVRKYGKTQGSATSLSSWKFGSGGLSNSRVSIKTALKPNKEFMKDSFITKFQKAEIFNIQKVANKLPVSKIDTSKLYNLPPQNDAINTPKDSKATESENLVLQLPSSIGTMSSEVNNIKTRLREFYKTKAARPITIGTGNGLAKRLSEINTLYDDPEAKLEEDAGNNDFTDTGVSSYSQVQVSDAGIKIASVSATIKPIGKLIKIGNSTTIGYSDKASNPTYNSIVDVPPLRDSIIHRMMKAGPDFMKNMYNVIFIKEDGSDMLTSSNEEAQRVYDTIGVRLEGITIPQQKNETFSINILDREVKKVGSKYNENHTVDLTFASDQNCCLLRAFYSLSGQKVEIVNDASSEKAAFEFIPSAFSRNDKLDIVVTYNEFFNKSDNMPYNNMVPSYFSRFMTPPKNGQAHSDMGTTNSLSALGAYKAFVFKDVRFLGISKSLDFNRDASDVITFGAQFRYKRLETIDTDLS